VAGKRDSASPLLDPAYWSCVLTRNGAQMLRKTLYSIERQTLAPKLIVVVDDGSTDETRSVIESHQSKTKIRIDAIRLPERGYDIRRVPANINAAYAYVEANPEKWDYSMISGDDCIYSRGYCASILARMNLDPQLVVASGDWQTLSPGTVKPPQGAGRFIKESFWREVGGKYPVAYGWESWLLYKAQQLGYRIANLQEVRFSHLRSSGSVHRFKYWGAAMRTLGFHPVPVVLRVAKNLIEGTEPIPFQGNLTMLASYLFPIRYRSDPYFQCFDEGLQQFVRQQQLRTLMSARKLQTFRQFWIAAWKVLERIFY